MIKRRTRQYKIPKLAWKLIGSLILSLIIAAFSFGFLVTTSYGIAQKSALENAYLKVDEYMMAFILFISLLGALAVFLVMFLYLIGQKVNDLLEINQAISQLEGGNLAYRIQLENEDEDELSELADHLNQLAQTLQDYRTNEKKLEEERVKLVRSLSHDIRTPLTAIIAYTDFIKDKKYDTEEKLEAYVQIIQNKAYQIKDLTQALLDHEQTIQKIKETNVANGHTMIIQLIEEYLVILEDEGFRVEVNRKKAIPFAITMPSQALIRIFDNLCSNIIKYADKEKAIYFTIEYESNKLRITQKNSIKVIHHKSVESHGIGLKNMEHILQAYGGQLDVVRSHANYEITLHLPIVLQNSSEIHDKKIQKS